MNVKTSRKIRKLALQLWKTDVLPEDRQKMSTTYKIAKFFGLKNRPNKGFKKSKNNIGTQDKPKWKYNGYGVKMGRTTGFSCLYRNMKRLYTRDKKNFTLNYGSF